VRICSPRARTRGRGRWLVWALLALCAVLLPVPAELSAQSGESEAKGAAEPPAEAGIPGASPQAAAEPLGEAAQRNAAEIPGAAAPVGDSAAQPAWRAAAPGFPWSFPADHWAHPEFQSEWWYLTGHLESLDEPGRRFGYQFTFFRVGLLPEPPRLDSAWSARALVMGHAALTDLGRGEHRFSELLYREMPLLAGFGQFGDERIAWSRGPQGTAELWELRWNGAAFDLSMADARQRIALELSTQPSKPQIFQGPQGLSNKSGDGTASSLYYSFTRLETHGRIAIDGVEHRVRGESWMDKELSSRQMNEQQSGWDWFSVQLADGRELMLYQLRDLRGGVSHASGTLVGRDADVRYLAQGDWTLRATARWTSRESGIEYPCAWSIEIPSEQLSLRLEPALADQENRSQLGASPVYWEGAVIVRDAAGEPAGRGYVELTGYGENTRPPL